MGGRKSRGVWDGPVHTTIFKLDDPQGLLYSAGNSAQCYMATWVGGESRGEWMHACVWLSRSAVHLKLSRHG